MDLKGSKTEVNLMKAFAGESQARNRYTYFAGRARADGLMQIADIFEETANQEKEHAKRFFNQLKGGEAIITADFPCGPVGSTLDNLKGAAEGENHEWTSLYPEFAKIAKDEGFDEISAIFLAVSIAEKQHERRYRGLYKNIAEGKVFRKDGKVTWRCRNCGYLHEGIDAPEKCPACAHPQAYFELLGENW